MVKMSRNESDGPEKIDNCHKRSAEQSSYHLIGGLFHAFKTYLLNTFCRKADLSRLRSPKMCMDERERAFC